MEGSFDSRLSVRVDNGVKHHFTEGYTIEIEGSLHKILKGQNAYDGFYNLETVCLYLIQFVENAYDIVLPDIDFWFLQRVDLACCFDLGTNENVAKYINNLSLCTYPRRKPKFYTDESIYLSGTSTTLKIYNKLLEFRKHELKKLNETNFDVINFSEKIKGFVRFECEIKKKTLKKYFDIGNIPVNNFNYEILKEIWKFEFMELLKCVDSDLKLVKNREEVFRRLNTLYKPVKARNLYNFYSLIMIDGLSQVKKKVSKATYFRNVSELKKASIDISQKYEINYESNLVDFNPFEWKEVV